MPSHFPYFGAPPGFGYKNYYPRQNSNNFQSASNYQYFNNTNNSNNPDNSNSNTSPTSVQNTLSEAKINEKNHEENRNFSNNPFSQFFSFIPTSVGPLNFHPEALNDINKAIFEMFGIQLFLDDIIIICILIFLYQEKVEDQWLYIALIALLI